MLITVIMLGAALLPTGDILWLDADPLAPIIAPALCYFRRLESHIFADMFKADSSTGASMVISLVVLISGYFTRILKLSDKASNGIRRCLRKIPSKVIGATRRVVLERLNRPAPSFHKLHWIVAYSVVETFYIWLKAFFDIYESMTAEVYIILSTLVLVRLAGLILPKIIWLASALAWGIRNLFMTRSDAANREENTWGFGQMFPVIIFVLPILSALETYYGEPGLDI